MTETKFTLQAALEALDQAAPTIEEAALLAMVKGYGDVTENAKRYAAILRDLRERLAGAEPAWQEGRPHRIGTLTAYALLFDSEQPRTKRVLVIPLDVPEEK